MIWAMSKEAPSPGGRLEVISGCMFSGKSERLLDRLAEAEARGVPAVAFKHASDDRYGRGEIVTHSGRRTGAIALASAGQIPELVGQARLIVIDEAQFFGADLVGVCRRLAEEGREVVAAGLDRDSWGQPFGPMPALEAAADQVTRTGAVCAACGAVAEYTQRVVPIEGDSMIGGPGRYEPRCARCFQPPPRGLRR